MKLRSAVISLMIGLSMLLLGTVLLLLVPAVVRYKVNHMLPLVNGSPVYDQWRNTTVPTFIQFWFFSVENPSDVFSGAKPILRQIGPYTYREYRIKHSIRFLANGSVSYKQRRLFYFDRDRSVGDESDTFTTVNIPLVVMGRKLQSYGDNVRNGASIFIGNLESYGLFITTSVRNITWGYEDPFLEKIEAVLQIVGLNIKSTIGLFHGKNNTDDGVYVVDSGTVNLDNYLSISSWNGINQQSIWNDKYANMINGTDGSMFAPFLNRSSRLFVYQSDLCRSIYVTFSGCSIIKGIPSFDFSAPDIVFANHSVNPNNYGFCVDGHCMGGGVLNLSKCIKNAPIVMSQPHFYRAAPEYLDAVVGLHPSSDYKTILRLEPTTGLPLQLQKKLQINLAMRPVASFMDMDNIPTVLMPLMWLNESAVITDELASNIRSRLIVPVKVGHWISCVLVVFGVVLTAVIIGINFNHFRQIHQLY